MTGASRGLLSVGLFAVELSTAVASPLCGSATGVQAKEGIFSCEFAFHVVTALLPALVSLGVVWLVHGRSQRSEERQLDAVWDRYQ